MKNNLVTIYNKEHLFIYEPQAGYGAEAFQIKQLLKQKKTLSKMINIYLYDGFAYIGKSGFLNIDSNIPEELNHYVKTNKIINESPQRAEKNCIYIPINLPDTIGIYGHYLIDTLTRFEFAKDILPKSNLGILLTNEHPDWVFDLIYSFFGQEVTIKMVSNEEVFNETMLIFSPFREHDYISDISIILTKYKNTNSNANRLIYLPRKESLSRGLKNREDTINLFKKMGFEVIQPETMSIKEQIKLFSQVKILAGEAGSALHNSIFSPSKTKIINIQSSRQSHFIQSGLCSHLGQDVTYFWSRSETDDWLSDHEVDIKLLENCLHKIIQ